VLFGLNIIGKNYKNKIIKSIICGIIILIVFLGLTAIKSLPSIELLDMSSRQQQYSYESLVNQGVFNSSNFHKTTYQLLGVTSLLLLLSFLKIKKRINFVLFGLLFFSLIMLTVNPIIHLMWEHVPFIAQMKGIQKALFMFILPATALVGIGMAHLIELISKKFSSIKNIENILHIIIFIIIILTMAYPFQKNEKFARLDFQLEKNQVMQYMSNDKDTFRFKAYETNGIDWGTDFYSVPLGLEDIYGYDNLWNPLYLPRFLSVANSQMAKLYGLLNMKYLTSQTEIEIPGFELVKKFEECGKFENGLDICQPDQSDGPYLYKNLLYLPRAFFAKENILVLGNTNEMQNLIFFLLTQNEYFPSNNIIFNEGSIDGMDQNLLDSFDMIILAGSQLSQTSYKRISDLAENGRQILPDITQGKTSFAEEDIRNSIRLINQNKTVEFPKKVNYEYYKSDIIKVDLSQKTGTLMISELFTLYPGWHAKIDGTPTKIYRVNGILSAVHINTPSNELVLTYEPQQYLKGKTISIITLISIVIIFAIIFLRYKKKN